MLSDQSKIIFVNDSTEELLLASFLWNDKGPYFLQNDFFLFLVKSNVEKVQLSVLVVNESWPSFGLFKKSYHSVVSHVWREAKLNQFISQIIRLTEVHARNVRSSVFTVSLSKLSSHEHWEVIVFEISTDGDHSVSVELTIKIFHYFPRYSFFGSWWVDNVHSAIVVDDTDHMLTWDRMLHSKTGCDITFEFVVSENLELKTS